MAYDQALGDRLAELLGDEPGYRSKKMFGGIAMMLDGNMACGVVRSGLLIRIDPAQFEELMTEPGAQPFEMGRQRASTGWIVVTPDAVADDVTLRAWVRRGVSFARSLPPK